MGEIEDDENKDENEDLRRGDPADYSKTFSPAPDFISAANSAHTLH